MVVADNKTDKLIKYSSSSSSDEVSFSYRPTGTYSEGIDLIYTSPDSIALAQSKHNISGLADKVRKFLRYHKNRDQVRQALLAIDAIETLISQYEDIGSPAFRISKSPDASLGISWTFTNALFGIYIQPDTSESSWFLIIGDLDKGLRADGNLDNLDYEVQLSPLFANLQKARRGK